MSHFFSRCFLHSFVLGFIACANSPNELAAKPSPLAAVSAQSSAVISVMTYNLENLFDAVDDPKKNDETYLALSEKKKRPDFYKKHCASMKQKKWREECRTLDWSAEVVEKKKAQLAKLVLAVADGKGPDVLFLQEVENLSVLSAWADDHLMAAGYVTKVLLEGPDVRGIDTAVLSKFPLSGVPKLIPLNLVNASTQQKRDSRDLLFVPLRLPDGSDLHAVAAHLPAPFHPAPLRVQSFTRIDELAQKTPKGASLLIGGDLNVTSEEEGRFGHFSKRSERFQVSHVVGCTGCRGSQYYPPKKSWSFLDALLVSTNTGKWRMVPESVRLIENLPGQLEGEVRAPRRFDGVTGTGYSDHLPIYAELRRVD